MRLRDDQISKISHDPKKALCFCSCVMVISIGQAPSAFTLDQNIGDFVLTNASLSIPKQGKIYSINEGNASLWDEATAK